MTKPFVRVGHRGAAGHEPENTMRSFRRAIKMGVDYIETDLQQTSDGTIVLIHDKRVDRTTRGKGLVREKTLKKLHRLDAGKGQKVPTLTELLDLAQGSVGLMLEIITPGLGVVAHQTVRAHGFSGPVLWASFHHGEMAAIRKVDAAASTMVLFEGVPVNGTRMVADAGATHVGLALDSVTEAFVGELQKERTQVFVYTANDKRDIAMLKAMKVDGVISDYPKRLSD